MIKRSLCIVLCAVLAWMPIPASAGIARTDGPAGELERRPPGPPAPIPIVPIAEDPEEFRLQMLDFLTELDQVLIAASQHPAIAEELGRALAAGPLSVPISQDTFDIFRDASVEELGQMREGIAGAPVVLSTPALLRSAIELMPVPDPEASSALGFGLGDCGDNYQEFSEILSTEQVVRNLTVAANSLALVHSISNTIAESAGAATEDVPYVGRIPEIPFIIITGILDVIVLALQLAADELSINISESELCLASCLVDDNTTKAGRGCDNRDNDCAGGTDEPSEDNFNPSITIDAGVLSRCYPDANAAEDAGELAVEMTDDCGIDAANSSVDTAVIGCTATVSSTAVDLAGNMTSGPMLQLKVDGDAPVISAPNLDACYDTLAQATAAMAATPISDVCDGTDVETDLTVVEKECVADFGLSAVDGCGNRSSVEDSARIDGSAPHVDIERLKIPDVDGLNCFATEAAAVATVAEATVFSDNCTSTEDLISNTTASGPACDLVVTSTATDECGQTASDSLVVRVDDEAPQISCSVATPILRPPDNRMVDIGFVLDVKDNCDGTTPHLDVHVTSDEPTRFAYTTGTADPFPDAVVTRAADGSIVQIQLRAQRRQTNTSDFDGRVYRIHVVATDSCGLQSETECWVTVPPNPGQNTAVNGGQNFDATERN